MTSPTTGNDSSLTLIEEYLLDIVGDAEGNGFNVVKGSVGYGGEYECIAAIRKNYGDPLDERRATTIELSFSYAFPETPKNGVEFLMSELKGRALATVGDFSLDGKCDHGLQAHGETLFADDFYERYKVRDSVRKKVDEAFQQLADSSFPGEDGINLATAEYHNDPRLFNKGCRRTLH